MESRSQPKSARWDHSQRDSAGFLAGICRRVEEGKTQGCQYTCAYEKGASMSVWYIIIWVGIAATLGWLAMYQPNDIIEETMKEEIKEHQRQMDALKKAVSK